MQTRKQTTLALAAALALTAGATHAENGRREIQRDYQRFTAAETSRQYERIELVTDDFFAPSFVLKTGKNTLTYPQFLQEMRATGRETRKVRENSFHPQTLRRQGDTIREQGVYVFSRTAVDPDGDFGAKGLMHQIDFRTTYQSVWVSRGSRLRLQSMKFVSRREVVDGRPVS